MKYNFKKLIALLLAAIMMLSLTGLGEGNVVIEDGAPVNGIIPDDIPTLDDVELDGQVDILESLTLDPDPQAPEKAKEVAAEEITEDQVYTNALVKKVSIGIKEKYTIDASSLSGKLTFATADKKIATVNKKGVVVGKKVGSTKITITDGQGKKYKITVTVAKAPNKVTLKKKKATLEIGDTLKLRAKLPNKTASNKLTWKSSNKRVATVSTKGEVEAIAAGTATITVKTFNGKKATCQVTVKAEKPEPAPEPTPEPPVSPTIAVDRSDVIVNVGETAIVKVTHTQDGRIYCSTSAGGVIRCEWSNQWVDNTTDLYLTGVGIGSTVVTIHDDAAGFSVPINVTVNSAPTPEPTPEPTPQPPVFSADPTSLSVEAGKSQNVRITYLNNNTIAWRVSNSDIVTCAWVDGWDGDTCLLTITGLRAGSATVTVYDKITQDYVDIYVTVYGNVEKITELSLLIFKTIPEANAALDMKLTYYKDNMYTSNYFSVLVGSDGAINTVGFFNNYGSYTLMGQWPGRSLSNAVNNLYNMGFKLERDVNQVGTFSHPELPGFRLLLKYANSMVDYLIFTTNASNVSNSFIQHNT